MTFYFYLGSEWTWAEDMVLTEDFNNLIVLLKLHKLKSLPNLAGHHGVF